MYLLEIIHHILSTLDKCKSRFSFLKYEIGNTDFCAFVNNIELLSNIS